MADIGSELTNSLDRQGRGGMLAPFKVADGTVSAPGVAFSNEPSSGWWRQSAGSLALSILGTQAMSVNATGLTVAQGLGVGGATNLSGILTVSATGGAQGVRLVNADGASMTVDTTGTNSFSSYRLNNGPGNSAPVGAAFHYFGSTYPGVNQNRPSSGNITTWGAGGFSISAENPTGNITFHTGGVATARMDISAAGNVNIPASLSVGGFTTGGANFNGAVDMTGAFRARGPIALDAATSGFYAGNAGTFGTFGLINAGGPLDAKIWQEHTDGASLNFRTINDTNSVGNIWLQVLRTGANPTSVAFPLSRFGIGTLTPNKNLQVESSGASVNVGVNNTTTTGFASLRINDPGANAGANGAALHHMGTAYAPAAGYFADGTTLTGFGAGGLNMNASANYRIFQGAAGTLRVDLNGSTWASPTLTYTVDRILPAAGELGNLSAARNQFISYNAGSAPIAGGWIAAAFGDTTADRVVIGQAAGRTILGSHNGALSDWSTLNMQAAGFNFRSPLDAVQAAISATGVFTYGGLEVGYRDIPINLQGSNYAIVDSDRGKHIATATAGITYTVNTLPTGSVVSVMNSSIGNITIAQGSGMTIWLGGTQLTGNRTLISRGIATLLWLSPTVVIATGAGLT
jgi:hypothetical protein